MRCQFQHCENDECCGPKGNCGTFHCLTGGVPFLNPQQHLCEETKCTEAECCGVKGNCATTSCILPDVPYWDPVSIKCKKQQCEYDECCGDYGRCSLQVCEEGTVLSLNHNIQHLYKGRHDI